jgi:hypothetical protein
MRLLLVVAPINSPDAISPSITKADVLVLLDISSLVLDAVGEDVSVISS